MFNASAHSYPHLHICIVVSISIVIFTIQCFSLKKKKKNFTANFVKQLNVVAKCSSGMRTIKTLLDLRSDWLLKNGAF